MGVMVGLAVGGRLPGEPPARMEEASPALAAPTLPTGVHSAFNNGIDCYRRAEYERADKFLKLAQAGQEDLTPDERQELANLLRINETALKGRREGAEQLRQAELAIKAGRLAQGEQLLRSLTTNQFLTAEDKVKVQHLNDRVRTEPMTPSTAKDGAGAVSTTVLARTKLQQARQLMAKANYDAAEALAHEVQQMKVTFRPGEDTPLHVLNDISRIRSDTRRLLSSARIALQCGDLDRAENLAKTAAKSGWSVSQLWGDSPAKVLKEVQAARARQGSTMATSPAKSAITPVKATVEPTRSTPEPVKKATAEPVKKVTAEQAKDSPISDADTARFFVQEGRTALKRGDLVKARECVAKAQALKVTFHWWEDNPGKLAVDIMQAAEKESRAHAKATTPPDSAKEKVEKPAKAVAAKETKPASVAAAKEKTPAPTPVEGSATAKVKAPADNPRVTLQKARELFASGKLDEAEHLAMQVQSSGFKAWGLFEESPEKLLTDIRNAKAHRAQVESARLLRDARAHFEKGEYETARTEAYQAERLHGPYSLWDMGDRPAKLIAEIDAAQAKRRKAANATAEATRKETPKAPAIPAPALNAFKGQGNPEPIRPAVYAGETDKPKNPYADFVPPPTVAASPTAPAATTAAKPVSPAAPTTPAPAAASEAVKKQQARTLLAEARHFQRDGKLVEARRKALEAQKVSTSWTAEEDRPDRALMELADLAHRRIEFLQQRATDLAATAAFADPTRFQKAEANLNEARQLAQGFALDTQAIDAKMSWVRQTRTQMANSQAKPAAPAVAQVMPAQHTEKPAATPTPQQQGQELLDKARMELKRGELETARRLAVEVYTGKYGLQDQADAVLHSIDVEEFNQRVLANNRAFETGLAAFLRKDYFQAGTIFRSLDPSVLAKEKQARLKEMMLMPEMQPHKLAQVPPPAPVPTPAPAPAPAPAVGRIGNPSYPPSPAPNAVAAQPAPEMHPVDTGHATASDAGPARVGTLEANYAQQVSALQEVQFQKLRDDGLKAQREAVERLRNGDAAQAVEILQEYLNTLKDVQLEREKMILLQRPVEARLQHLKQLKAQQDFEKEKIASKDTFNNLMQRETQLAEHKKQQVKQLMDKYDKLYKEAKYAEAEMAATQARELDPDNAAAAAAVHVARLARHYNEFQKLKERKEEFFVKAQNDAEEPGPAVDLGDPLKFDESRWKMVKDRKAFPKDGWGIQIKTEKEREIERRLSLPISLDFKDQTLKNVLDDLRDLTGINIVPDMPALEAENISLDRPITMHLEGVSTKSALTLILHQAHLIYVIADEVVKVTTEAYSRGKLVTKTYQVADLIIPVENHTAPDSANMTKLLEKMGNQPAALQTTGATPYMNPNSMRTGTPVGSPTGGSAAPASSSAPEKGRAPGQTLEDVLIKMITSTIKPESWSDMGGPGTIEFFPLGMALVINQTPDIQEQVAELLTALRRLQDLEVTVEVRFIALDEAFFERIGLDFNLNVVTHNNPTTTAILTSPNQQFQPFGFNNVFNPQNFITGLVPGGSNQPNGAFTQDLNIPILNSSFGPAIPPFGGFPNAPGADGGLSLGLAFLSDIQVFMFLEAAQADRRTNVTTAPKLTLFNGQSSNINIMEQQFFVTSMVVTQVNGQVVFSPQNQALPVGSPMGMPSISLAIQAVVTADRRFVRLNLNPVLTALSSPVSALFPVTTFITPVFESGAQGQPVPFTQYLQQPSFQTIDVMTTVMVPDGGTVLLGGMKTLREGRNEFGPPILSKLPYVSRLFKNVGYGKETESLLIMVTPRIIINEEEETRQTGVGEAGLPPAGGPAGAAAPGPGPAAGPTP
jgi:type II secretory pathway component GspD/PulD (secretin)